MNTLNSFLTSFYRSGIYYRSGSLFRSSILVIGFISLSACGGGKTIATVDKSADYKTAASLPPLKKPSPVTNVRQGDTPTVSSVEVNERSDAVAESETVASESRTDVSEDNSASDSSVTRDAKQPDSVTVSGVVTANVISPKANVSRLQIEAEFSGAWAYLNRSLQRSDITVFSRNRVAGQYAIGCSGIDSAPTVEKKGGWSFFNKKQKSQKEYCTLQAVATRGVTVVTVLNRTSEEVDGQSASQIFSRILNN